MGAWPVYYVWPMPSHFIFESPDNWLITHKADWRWPIIILLIGRDGQSRGQRAFAGGVLGFTHRIPITAMHTGICETELLYHYHKTSIENLTCKTPSKLILPSVVNLTSASRVNNIFSCFLMYFTTTRVNLSCFPVDGSSDVVYIAMAGTHQIWMYCLGDVLDCMDRWAWEITTHLF